MIFFRKKTSLCVNNNIRVKVLVALIAFLFTCIVCGTPYAQAVSTKQLQLWRSGNFNYDSEVACDTTAIGTVGNAPDSLDPNVLLPYIYTWLRGKRLTPLQAAGVVGNLAVESGGIPTRKQGAGIQTSKDPTSTGSLGWGIMQWSPGSKVLTRAKEAGVTTPIYELDTQLNILYWELTNKSEVTGKENMLEEFTQTTVGTKQNQYKDGTVYYYERNMEGAGHPAYNVRVKYANIALENYESASNSALYSATTDASSSDTTSASATDTSALSATTSLSQSGCLPSGVSSGTNQSFVATVMKYTWPFEWRSGNGPGVVQLPGMDTPKRPGDPTEKTQAYKAAIEKAKKTYFNKSGELSPNGSPSFQFRLYVGANGVDCGGFVTRLLQDSGLDPHYNMVDNKGRVYNGPTSTQADYLANSGVWKKIESSKPTSYYRPGDVAIQDGHTLIFVGEISTFWMVRGGTDKGGGGTVVNPLKVSNASGLRKVLLASASQDLRSPMADKDEVVGSSAYTWYRYSGTSTATTADTGAAL